MTGRNGYLKERAVSILDTDRLAEFNRLAYESKVGCFYIALLSCYRSLYPLARIPAGWEEMVLGKFGGLGVWGESLVRASQVAGGRLGMSLRSITMFTDPILLSQDMDSFRGRWSVPSEVAVYEAEGYLGVSDSSARAAVMIMVETEVGSNGAYAAHAVSASPGPFQGQMRGGKQELDEFVARGFVPLLELFFERCPRTKPVFQRVSDPSLSWYALAGE